jgi:hypothetical protein
MEIVCGLIRGAGLWAAAAAVGGYDDDDRRASSRAIRLAAGGGAWRWWAGIVRVGCLRLDSLHPTGGLQRGGRKKEYHFWEIDKRKRPATA